MKRKLLGQLQLAHSRRCDRFYGNYRISAGSRHRMALIRRRIQAETRRKDGCRIWSPPMHRRTCDYRTKEGFTREPRRDGIAMHKWNKRRPIGDFGRDRLDDMIPF